jgi:hypothetical protein
MKEMLVLTLEELELIESSLSEKLDSEIEPSMARYEEFNKIMLYVQAKIRVMKEE